MKRRILARSEYWLDERRLSDATAGLRFVRESVALSTFNIAQDIEGEECVIDHESAYRCPSGELIYGAWQETGGECANGRLYNGVALGLAALAGAMTGAGWYRFLPLGWNSIGPDNEDMGAHGFDEVRIDGLKGCDASRAADYARDGKPFIPADAYAAILRCSDNYGGDSIALENFAKRSADDAAKVPAEYWARCETKVF